MLKVLTVRWVLTVLVLRVLNVLKVRWVLMVDGLHPQHRSTISPVSTFSTGTVSTCPHV